MGLRNHASYDALVSPWCIYGLPVLYLALSIAGNFAMRNPARRTPAWVSLAMKLYNAAQIALCMYMSIGLLPVIGWPNIFGVNTAYTAAAEWYVLVHYVSKFFDWFDTLWMILRRKSSVQMSFLHLYHHASIGVVWGFMLSVGHANGTVSYGAFINSVTHVIMYAHFLWTSCGLSNPYKRLVTTWQIAQFYSCFVHSLIVLGWERHVPRSYAWLQFCYHLTMIYLFTFKLKWVPALLRGPDEPEEAALDAKGHAKSNGKAL